MHRKTEIEVVKKVGEKIGYGHMMEIASALWRQKMKDAKEPLSGVYIPALLCDIDSGRQEATKRNMEYYDNMFLEHE